MWKPRKTCDSYGNSAAVLIAIRGKLWAVSRILKGKHHIAFVLISNHVHYANSY